VVVDIIVDAVAPGIIPTIPLKQVLEHRPPDRGNSEAAGGFGKGPEAIWGDWE
jgi:hypothetical protein